MHASLIGLDFSTDLAIVLVYHTSVETMLTVIAIIILNLEV